MALLFSIIVLLELFSALLAAVILFRRLDFTTAESFSYAVVVIFAFYSTTIQVFFLLHIPRFYYFMDLLIIAVSISVITGGREILRSVCRAIVGGARPYKLWLLPFGVLYVYLFLQVLLLPPSNEDSLIYNVSRVLMMQQENGLFLKNYSTLRQVDFPVGYDILHFLFLRFHSDYFLAIFSFISYTAVIVSTYGLANIAYNNKRLSLTTAVVTGSLIEVVLQSTITKNDLPSAAMVAVCFLAGYRYAREQNGFSFLVLLTALFLAVSFKGYVLGFALPFAFLYSFFLIRKFPLRRLIDSLRPFKRYAALSLLPCVTLLCFVIFGANNYARSGNFFGTPLARFTQRDGMYGAGINALRYAVQTVDLPYALGGGYISELLAGVNSRNPGVGTVRLEEGKEAFQRCGCRLARRGRWEVTSWYGPLGFLVIAPAILFSLLRGDGYLRLSALSLLSFYFLLCYMVGWMQPASRFFSLFFAGSGLCAAFFIKKVVNQRYYKYVLLLCLLVFAYAALSNSRKPFLDIDEILDHVYRDAAGPGDSGGRKRPKHRLPGPLVLNWVYFVTNRDAYFDEHFSHRGVKYYKELIKPDARVLIVADDYAWVFPFLVRRPDLDITITNPLTLYHEGRRIDLGDERQASGIINDYEYVLAIDVGPLRFMDGDEPIVSLGDRFLLYDIRDSRRAGPPEGGAG